MRMFSTGRPIAEADSQTVSHRRGMPISLVHAIALAEARSCLAALADRASDFDESVHFEHLLLDLDSIHPDWPSLHALDGGREALLRRLEEAVDRMLEQGGGVLALEVLLAEAHDYRPRS